MIFCAMWLSFHLDASHLICHVSGSVCLPLNRKLILRTSYRFWFLIGCVKLVHVGPSSMLSRLFLAELFTSWLSAINFTNSNWFNANDNTLWLFRCYVQPLYILSKHCMLYSLIYSFLWSIRKITLFEIVLILNSAHVIYVHILYYENNSSTFPSNLSLNGSFPSICVLISDSVTVKI